MFQASSTPLFRLPRLPRAVAGAPRALRLLPTIRLAARRHTVFEITFELWYTPSADRSAKFLIVNIHTETWDFATKLAEYRKVQRNRCGYRFKDQI